MNVTNKSYGKNSFRQNENREERRNNRNADGGKHGSQDKNKGREMKDRNCI